MIARRAHRARSRLAAAAIAVGIAGAGCGSKSAGPSGPPPEVTGLAAVPFTADVVIGVDVAKLADSPLVERAIDQMLLRDPVLAEGWQSVRDGCKIDLVKQVRRVMLALGPTPPNGRPGTGPVLMIATGSLPENDLSECIGKLVGKGQGSVTGKDAGGRTLYQVKDGARAMFFAFGRADTVVLGTNEAYVVEALSPGKKALDHSEFARWLRAANQNAPVWAVGRVDERIRTNLVKVTANAIKAGPSAIIAAIDPSSGAKLDLRALMASAEDAKALESWTKNQLGLISAMAQSRSLGAVIHKVSIAAEGSALRLAAALTLDDVNHVLRMLDGGGPAEQISPPPPPTQPPAAGSGAAGSDQPE